MTLPVRQALTVLDVGLIEVVARLRPVSAQAVATLVASIQENGHILNPLLVQRTGSAYRLIDGAHRLAAARELGLERVPVSVFECGVDQALRMEVDGNMAGAPMSALDTAVFLAARKRLYEKDHPEARRGFAGGKARHQLTLGTIVSSFAEAAALAMGKPKVAIYRLVAAGARLTADEVAQLRRAPGPVRLDDLLGLNKINDDEERGAVIAALGSGTAKSTAAARAAHAAARGGKPPKTSVEAAFQALQSAWSRAPKEARRRFVEHLWDDIEALAPPDGVSAEWGALHGKIMGVVREAAE